MDEVSQKTIVVDDISAENVNLLAVGSNPQIQASNVAASRTTTIKSIDRDTPVSLLNGVSSLATDRSAPVIVAINGQINIQQAPHLTPPPAAPPSFGEPPSAQNAIPGSNNRDECERVEAIVSRYMRVDGIKPPITDFFRISFGGKYLSGNKADCSRLNFQPRTDLSNADFTGTDCSSTKFIEVILKDVKFKDTLLEYAEITNADGLTAEQLSEAVYDKIIVGTSDTKGNKNIRDHAGILRLERLNKVTQDSIDILEKFISFFPQSGDKNIIAMIRLLPPEKIHEMAMFLTEDVRYKLFETVMVSAGSNHALINRRGYVYGRK